MKVPEISDAKWDEVICSDKEYQFKFLATKILLGRLRLNYKNINTSDELEKCKSELRNFFEKNENIPVAVNDMNEIFGG